MSQPELISDLDVTENSQHPCQCSVINNMDSIRIPRERIGALERNMGSTRISNTQDLPRSLETLQSVFEPVRRLESPHQENSQLNLDNARNIDLLEHQTNMSNPRSINSQSSLLSLHGHNISCSPRNLDLSRNLALEAARRVQENSSLQEHSQHSLTSSPSPLLEVVGPNLLETASKELDKQLEEHGGLSAQKQSSSKDKLKNVQQVLNPYQHHHEPAAVDRGVHGHFHGDMHAHIHKHTDNFRGGTNLDAGENLMGYQQHQRQHTHHHRGNAKTNVAHHYGSGAHHTHSQGHHHGNLTTSLTGHVHGNSGPLSASSGSSSMNQTSPTSPTGHRHPSMPIASATINHVNSPHSHHRLNGGSSLTRHSNPPAFPSDHHGASGALSGASSNSSMMNHGGSPTVHRHAVNVNGSLSTTPLGGHHHGSSSGSLTGHSSVNHHHVSSGISCESSSSNANTRAHSRLDHVRDHHHHLQPVHPLHPSHPDSRPRDRAPSSLDHHGHHHGHVHNHSHPHGQNDTKNASLMGVDAIQVSVPTKNKCQCHVVQQPGGNNGGIEDESDGNVEVTSRMHQPPALPPRPPPRPARRYETTAANQCHAGEGGCCKKYVVLCCLCGGLSTAVGSLFLAVHAILSAHTASLALFETVPSYIPGIMLIVMGLFTIMLARRKHRYGLLMKVCGSVAVVCALVCVLVTVTTTVIHMSRLQNLRECVYTARARSCTCYGAPPVKGGDPGVLFEGTAHCDAVHGALSDCLRALFGVSVAGILACIFSCMLVYQLLSHEKKKMYWEQLELRCRSLYGQGGTVGSSAAACGCCNDCGGASPWWAQTPGNLYTPNPDMAPSRRWRLPWSRSRGPAPSPDSNYGFHTQARPVETNAESGIGPYSVLNSQSSGPYSVLNTQSAPYTPSTASYSVLEAPVPLWGPPPPYSDPNSPARRLPQVIEARARIAKRIDNFENNEDHRPRSAKRPSDNYENAEEISNSTDPEGGNEGTIKGRRARKPLKGVENGGFQQEANSGPKQSESELYFGDVSSCCGPESSFYDLAVEKEGAEHTEGVDYLAARLGKRQLSKRSRMPLPLPTDHGEIPSDNYANSDEPRNARGPFLAPDAQYEVIQQGRYSYYASKDDEEPQEGPASSSYFREDENERGRERDYRDYRNSQEEETPQCCMSDSTTLDSGWQSGEQQQSDDNVRPVNV